MKENGVIQEYTGSLSRQIREEYHIGEEYYHGEIKRGLRNSDGTGVMVGVTKVGSVQGYLLQDGQRIPIPGRLYYRGIELNDIVEAHRAEGTFGFEEVAYLLLMGYLPSQGELRHFNEIMNRARKLPEGFTEGMIMRRTSGNIMNELGRSILSLYSYDPDPDDLSVDNLLRQSVELIGYFPSIVANAYAVKRHHFGGESLHIHYPEEGLSTAENFLRMIRPDKSYTEEEAHLLDMMLMLHAEHGGGNNSTFVCRALSSSGTDTYSAIAGAVGSLKGPLHGGANAKVMEMPAIRVSYMVLPGDLLDIYRRDCSFYSCTVSRIDQRILNEFIRDGYFERHLNKMRMRYRAKHDLLLAGLEPFKKQFVISGEDAGLHLLLTAKGNVTEQELLERAAAEKVKAYGMSENMVEATMRKATVLLGFGSIDEAEMQEGLRRLQKAWL